MAVIIPAYNEQDNIGAVVAEVKAHAAQTEVVVIDDGSSDSTAAAARAAGATVISLLHNLGISRAVQTGYHYASRRNYDVVVRIDGDGQHDAAFIADLIQPIANNEADVVVGSRFVGGSTYHAPLARTIGIRLFATLVLLVTGRRFTDTTSGFHACNAQAARFLAEHMPEDYPEIEGVILLCRAGFRVVEVPVAMRERQAGVSSIGALRACYYVFKVTLAILIGLLRRYPTVERGSHA